MREDSRYSASLTYGLREQQILEEIKQLGKEGKLPENKNEVLRRGLHSVRFLAEVDEKYLLSLLSELLHSGSKRYDSKVLTLAKEVSYTIYAIMVAKYGTLRAETFDSIIDDLQLFDRFSRTEKLRPKEIEEDYKKSMERLAISVDTVFLKSAEGVRSLMSEKLLAGRR